MATYKIWLTVKDRYGTLKEIDGGVVNVGLDKLTADEINVLDNRYATDAELAAAVESSNDTIRYSSFELADEVKS
jgi:hypothetical protein